MRSCILSLLPLPLPSLPPTVPSMGSCTNTDAQKNLCYWSYSVGTFILSPVPFLAPLGWKFIVNCSPPEVSVMISSSCCLCETNFILDGLLVKGYPWGFTCELSLLFSRPVQHRQIDNYHIITTCNYSSLSQHWTKEMSMRSRVFILCPFAP